MAKDIQLLPRNAPNPVCLATLGWLQITSLVDKMKLLFVWRLLSLNPCNIYRKVFVYRFFSVLLSSVMTNISPVAQIISVCIKYKILDHVRNSIQTGKIPSKDQWKCMVIKVISDLEFSSWRLDTKMYHHL